MQYQYNRPPMPYWTICKEWLDASHVLIAGTTGSGKSVALNSTMFSLLGTTTPARAKYYLIDPKVVELQDYKDCSDYCLGYTTTSQGAITILRHAISGIEQRYRQMASMHIKSWTKDKVYIFIDELADLMVSTDRKEIMLLLQKILQIGRAAGYSIIACTQAPNRKIIPAELTLNFTDRVGLRTISAIESRQIVQISGCEKLPIYGQGIYLSPTGLSRIEIPYTPEDELQKSISYWLNYKPIRIA